MSKQTKNETSRQEQAVVGLDWRGQRLEPGDPLPDGLPEESRVWLRQQGLIKPCPKPKAKAPVNTEGVE